MSAKDFIVAIELGSSKVTGIAGRKNLDGSINVLAVAREDSSSFIRKGVVYNIDKTALCISNIINKLSTQLKTQIIQVYVGVGGQSIRSVRNTISRDFASGTKVTQEMVVELMDSNRNMHYPDLEILDAAAQEYKVDTVLQIDPVGIQCSHLEGTFLNILERTEFYKKLNRCFEAAGVNVAEMYLAPLALADSVLTETEKRSGCALIDIGYDTTTVSVYSKNILRHLSVVPLGSGNITKDIASLLIEESDAEKMKIKYASAYTENADIDNELMLSLGDGREVSSRKFIEIVEGRVEEIIENAWHQIPTAYTDKLLGGLIITGGGSNLKNIEKAFTNHTHIEKTRIAKFVTGTIISNNADINAKNGMMNTILGLLAKGEINCAGEETNADLFSTSQPHIEETAAKTTPTQVGGSRLGSVPTEAQKKQAEEDAERKRKEAEEERRRKEEEEEERLRQERRENSLVNKFVKWTKKMASKMTEEE